MSLAASRRAVRAWMDRGRAAVRGAIYRSPAPLPYRWRIYAARAGRLNQTALIAPDLSFLYVLVPKAANSTVKRVLWRLRGVEISDTEAMGLVHRGPGPYLSFADLPRASLDRALRAPGVFRFTFVRNPYTRLVSAYRDKILNLNGNGEVSDWYLERLGMPWGSKPTFDEFARKVAAQKDEAANWHWLSQHRCVLSQLVHYDFVGKVETFDEDFSEVLSRIGAPPGSFRPEDSLNRNPFRAPANRPDIYDDDLAGLVFRRYEADFRLFGYDADSYRGLK